MGVTIGVLYSCRTCGLKDVTVQVRAREDNEEVVAWMEACGKVLGADHFLRNPHCRTESLSDIKIPITGADRVGGAPVEAVK